MSKQSQCPKNEFEEFCKGLMLSSEKSIYKRYNLEDIRTARPGTAKSPLLITAYKLLKENTYMYTHYDAAFDALKAHGYSFNRHVCNLIVLWTRRFI